MDKDDFHRLLNKEIPQQWDLLLKQSLFDVELGPLISLSKSSDFFLFSFLSTFNFAKSSTQVLQI